MGCTDHVVARVIVICHARHMSDIGLLGVDVGTSSSKGVLVTRSGEILRTAVREHMASRPHPGHVEMDAELWWKEFVELADELTAPGDCVILGRCAQPSSTESTPAPAHRST